MWGGTCGGQRTTRRNPLFFHHLGSKVRLRSIGLTKSSFSCQTILPDPGTSLLLLLLGVIPGDLIRTLHWAFPPSPTEYIINTLYFFLHFKIRVPVIIDIIVASIFLNIQTVFLIYKYLILIKASIWQLFPFYVSFVFWFYFVLRQLITI